MSGALDGLIVAGVCAMVGLQLRFLVWSTRVDVWRERVNRRLGIEEASNEATNP